MGKIKDLTESFNFVDTNQAQSMNSFINETLWMVNQYHIWHLQTKDYSEHMAIGEFYDKLEDLLDSLAENFIGAKGEFKVDAIKPYSNYSKSTVVTALQNYGELVSDVASKVQDKNSSKVIMDEIESLVASTLYKLGLK
jgi:DNA-binding ferritin-like protein